MPAYMQSASGLEAESEAELASERARNVGAGRVDETSRSSKVVSSCLRINARDVSHHVVSVVSAIGEIEGLSNNLHICLLTNFEVLAKPGVKLEERISA